MFFFSFKPHFHLSINTATECRWQSNIIALTDEENTEGKEKEKHRRGKQTGGGDGRNRHRKEEKRPKEKQQNDTKEKAIIEDSISTRWWAKDKLDIQDVDNKI